MADRLDDPDALHHRLNAYAAGLASMVSACRVLAADVVALADDLADDPTVSSAAKRTLGQLADRMAAVMRDVAADLHRAGDPAPHTEH